MRIYVAARWLCKPQARTVMDALKDRGHHITYDWTVVPDGANHELEAVHCLDGVVDADAVVVLPHETGQGLYSELGVALALSKPVVCLAPTYEVRDGGKYPCIFLSHPLVRKVGTLAEVVGALESDKCA